MNYICVEWEHDFADEPVTIYSEMDPQGWERRKIEVFRNGSIGLASSSAHFGNSYLSEAPLPLLDEINADPQFFGQEVARAEFSRLWSQLLLEIGAIADVHNWRLEIGDLSYK